MFRLPQLNYDVASLAPWVSATTMSAHHDHHHATYVDKLNAAFAKVPADLREKYFGDAAKDDFLPAGSTPETKNLANFLTNLRRANNGEKIYRDDDGEIAQKFLSIDAPTRKLLINNGGGHYNHSLFWRVLTPKSDGEPRGILAEKLNEKYGSFQNFADQFETAATGLFGSGWVWLTQNLDIATSANQDLAPDDLLIGLDLWEHAYYLDYKWNRADYVKAWWAHVDWDFATARFSDFAKN